MGNFGIIDEALNVLQITQEELRVRYLGKSYGYISSIRVQNRYASTSSISNWNQRLRLHIDSLGNEFQTYSMKLTNLLAITEYALMQQAVLACHGKSSALFKSP